MDSMQCNRPADEIYQRRYHDNSLSHKVAEMVGWQRKPTHQGHYPSEHKMVSSQTQCYGQTPAYYIDSAASKPCPPHYIQTPTYYPDHITARLQTHLYGQTDGYPSNLPAIVHGQPYGQPYGHHTGYYASNGMACPGKTQKKHKKKQMSHHKKSKDRHRSCSDSDDSSDSD